MPLRDRTVGPLRLEPCMQQAKASADARVAAIEGAVRAGGCPSLQEGDTFATPPHLFHDLDAENERFLRTQLPEMLQ